MNKSLTISLKDDNTVTLLVEGELSFEEAMDMVHTAQFDLLNSFERIVIAKNKDVNETQLKNDIYDRAVLGFSLMIDKFHPERKKTKFNNLTDEAILEASNRILLKSKTVIN